MEAGHVVRVQVITDAEELSWEPPEVLFELRDYVFPDISARQYDVASDGRFLMLRDAAPSAERAPVQIALVQDWFTELQRLVPTPELMPLTPGTSPLLQSGLCREQPGSKRCSGRRGAKPAGRAGVAAATRRCCMENVRRISIHRGRGSRVEHSLNNMEARNGFSLKGVAFGVLTQIGSPLQLDDFVLNRICRAFGGLRV